MDGNARSGARVRLGDLLSKALPDIGDIDPPTSELVNRALGELRNVGSAFSPARKRVTGNDEPFQVTRWRPFR